MDKGEVFKINCTSCGQLQTVEVNGVHSKMNKWVIMISIVVGVLLVPFLWGHIGAVSSLALAIPIWIWKTEQDAMILFNSYEV